MPVAVVDSAGTTSTVSYVHADALNTPRAVTDASGNIRWQWSTQANPFGEQPPTAPTGYVFNLRFPGQYFDSESNLTYNLARHYEAATGRFIQPDPIGQRGGLGLYIYGLDTPLVLSDFTGLSPYPSWGSNNIGASDRACSRIGKGGRNCEEQAVDDEAVCRSLPNTTKEEKAVRSRCWASVQERFGACEANRPLPPLVTWSVAAPNTDPVDRSNDNQSPNTHTLPVLPLPSPVPMPAPTPLPIFEPVPIPVL